MHRARFALAALALMTAVAGARLALHDLHAEVISISGARAGERGAALKAQAAARRAVAMRPREYRYLEQAAAAEARLRRPQHALHFLREALHARPNWPYAWARLAHAHLQSGGDPQQLDQALAAVSRYGDNERGLWKLFAMLALEPETSAQAPAVRAFLDERLTRELRGRAPHITGYALVHRHEVRLCRHLSAREPEPDWCGKALYVRQVCDGGAPLTAAQTKWCEDVIVTWQYMDYPAE